MSLKPILMKPSPLLQEIYNSNKHINKYQQQQDQAYELTESSLTVRENEEFLINCNVESSKPAADIKFSISSNVGGGNVIVGESISNNNYFLNSLPSSAGGNSLANFFSTISTTTLPPVQSIISSSTNVAKNNDRTFKTVHSAKLKANLDDHGKVITCKAENGFSNQKWENRKLLNVLCKRFF